MAGAIDRRDAGPHDSVMITAITELVLPSNQTVKMNLLETNLGEGTIPKRRGKVRDVYDLGERLLLVATDRISAFDWVLPSAIPDKGRVLTGLSEYWFDLLKIPNHLITTDVDAAGLNLTPGDRVALRGRSMMVRKARV